MISNRRLQILQASRGVAALLVLLFHLTYLGKTAFGVHLLKGVFRFGASGVDFFFVLSGFIIFFIHSGDTSKPDRLWPYLKKRFVRVFPLYWFVALVLIPLWFSPLVTALRPSQYAFILLKSFLLLPQVANPMLMVGWTLTFEVFFYSLFALAICFSKPVIRTLAVMWLTLSFISYLDKLGLAGPLAFISPARIRFLQFVFSFYNLEFAMGCLVAFALKRFQVPHSGKLAVGAAAVFIVAGLHESFSDQKFFQVSGVVNYGLPAAVFILGAVSWEIRQTVSVPAVLLFLGDASYSIYLTHLPVLNLLIKLALAKGLGDIVGPGITLLIVFLVTLGVGILCYVLVERPLLTFLSGKMFSLVGRVSNFQVR
jgi:exopolysaccharide production protein ExoZ